MTYPKFDPKLAFRQILDGVRGRNYAPAVIQHGHPDEVYCAYDSPVGPCAVGLILPPELRALAAPVLGGVDTLRNDVPVINDYFSAPSVATESDFANFLRDVQEAHDSLHHQKMPANGWEAWMARIARDYANLGIVYTPPGTQPGANP